MLVLQPRRKGKVCRIGYKFQDNAEVHIEALILKVNLFQQV
jgi:hypothetical protein